MLPPRDPCSVPSLGGGGGGGGGGAVDIINFDMSRGVRTMEPGQRQRQCRFAICDP